MSEPYRLVIYHKHPSSGRTLFLRLNDSICHFERLSHAAQVIETESDEAKECPPALIEEAETKLGLTPDLLVIHGDFAAQVEEAGTKLTVFLGRLRTTDAPHELLAAKGGKLIAITEARHLPPGELELLRLAYSVIMGD